MSLKPWFIYSTDLDMMTSTVGQDEALALLSGTYAKEMCDRSSCLCTLPVDPSLDINLGFVSKSDGIKAELLGDFICYAIPGLARN